MRKLKQQHFMVRFATLEKADLKPTEALAFGLIDNRMVSSEMRQEFFDDKINAYYVIYTHEEMAKRLNVSVRSIGRAMKSLIQKGLVKIKKTMQADRIFINWNCEYLQDEFEVKPETDPEVEDEEPKLDNDVQNDINDAFAMFDAQNDAPKVNENNEKDKMSDSKLTNCPNNYTHSIYTKNQGSKNIDKETENKETGNPTEITDSEKISKAKNQAKFDGRVLALKAKGIPERIVNMLASLSFNDDNTLNNYAGIMFKAKRDASKATKDNKRALVLEYNSDLVNELPRQLQTIITGAIRNADNTNGYIYKSLKDFFTDMVYKWEAEHDTSNDSGLNIPFINLDEGSLA